VSRVAVIGAGYVGLTTAACLADLGNDVVVVDINREKINQLLHNHVPFFEPGLSELVERNTKAGRLNFTTSYNEAVPGAEYAIIAVSTPEGEGGEADLSFVEAAAGSIADAMDGPLVVVNKSTVPPLTGDMVSKVLRNRNQKHTAEVVSNPEFLREGSAIQDFMHPDRVVIGSHDRAAADKVAKLYEPLDAPILITPNIYTAEMVKYASNAFLAARISFINEIARISERVGADAKLVAEGMGMDKRIGPSYLDVGLGYGGSCLVGEETVMVRRGDHVSVMPLAQFFSDFSSTEETEVMAWRPDTGSVGFARVSAATMRPYEGEILEVRTKMGRRVLCTPDHPFATRSGVKLASELGPDDSLPLVIETQSAFGAVARRAVPMLAIAGSSDPGAGTEATNGTDADMQSDVAHWQSVGVHLANVGGRLPDDIWTQAPISKRALLSGFWMGDGTWSTSTSRVLADGLLRLLGDLGMFASMHVIRTANPTRDAYRIRTSDDDEVGCEREGKNTAWVRVVGVERRPFSGAVYSLEVPDVHTFVTTGGLVTHNCFPKDVKALSALAERFDYHPELLHAVMDINRDQRMLVIDKLRECLEGLNDRIVGLLGLAFKPNTDDLREAPSIDIARVLLAAGAQVRAYDPAAMEGARVKLPEVEYTRDSYDLAEGADALVVVTEWNEFRRLDLGRVKASMRRPVIVDGRNIYDPQAMRDLGFTYRGIGRD
jgi:UDP-glucose 6-dehydrogenase